MKSIRGGKGLGDALYVQSVARHLVERGERLEVCTTWPDVFRPLGDAVTCSDFRRDRIDVLAHYSMRKAHPTRQWQDICIQAGIKEPVELRLDWANVHTGFAAAELDYARLVTRRKLVLVQLPRVPMDRKDSFGRELLPNCKTIQRLIWLLRDLGALIVQIGSGKPLFRFDGIDIDLANHTTVRELFDLALQADAFLGYVSFVVPLAESLNKRALLVWSRAGLKAPQAFVRQITPQKILEKPTSRWVWDDANERQLMDAANELL